MKEIVTEGTVFKTVRLRHEWFEDIEDPTAFVRQLQASKTKADFFTFWQRLPDVHPNYSFFHEKVAVAAVPLKDYDYWWNKQINSKTRNLIRKAEKAGLVMRVVPFD